MNIYLEIENVLVSRRGYVSPYANKFIEALSGHKVYVLTNDSNFMESRTFRQLLIDLTLRSRNIVQLYRQAPWDLARTDGINYSDPLLWFTPSIEDVEAEDLQRHKCEPNAIITDINKNGHNLKRYIGHLPEPVKPEVEGSPFPHRVVRA